MYMLTSSLTGLCIHRSGGSSWRPRIEMALTFSWDVNTGIKSGKLESRLLCIYTEIEKQEVFSSHN